jgi:S1-C subfamily serine protease
MNLDRARGLAAPARARRAGLGIAVLAAALVATACTPDATSTTSATAGSAPGLQNAFVDTVRAVQPSVVEIQTSTGLGSGVIFDHAGDIVTNNHVVGTATTVSVLVNGSSMSGRVAGTYPASDLAVITVNSPTPLSPAKFGPASSVEVGDVVLAMGDPLGRQGSTSEGIVSAVGRKVVEPGVGERGTPGATLSDVIQTSAAINPRNSGGALVNLAGEVIGIPTLTATDPQIGGTAPGIGFAVPAGTVTDVARQLIAHGRVTTPPK